MRRGLIGGSLVLLLLVVACGGGKKDTEAKDSTPAATPAAAGAPAFPGEPPTTPVTAAMDRVMTAVKFPSGLEVLVRRDITNEATALEVPEVGQRFKETGRQIGAYYIIGAGGAPRMTLSINQYEQADGARREFQSGRGNPAPADRIETPGIGDEAAASCVRLQSGEATATPLVISFIRGRYYVVIAEPAASPEAPPDDLLALARAVDTELKTRPLP